MTHSDAAVASFKQGFACSQAVLSAYAEEFNLHRDKALKVAAGLGGGMGRMGLTCGAVTGAYMVIGLKYGGIEGSDQQAKQKTYQVVREFTARFNARHDTTVCKDLLGIDISTAEGFEKAKQQGLLQTRCPLFVADAAEILDDLLKA